MSQPGNPGGTSGPEAIDRDVRTLREVSRGSPRSLSTGCDRFLRAITTDHGHGESRRSCFPQNLDGWHPRGGEETSRFCASSLAGDIRRFLWSALIPALVAMSQSVLTAYVAT